MRPAQSRPGPLEREAANRIKDAASVSKQERGFFGAASALQAFDIPRKFRTLRDNRNGFDQSVRGCFHRCMVAMHPAPVDATSISVSLNGPGLNRPGCRRAGGLAYDA